MLYYTRNQEKEGTTMMNDNTHPTEEELNAMYDEWTKYDEDAYYDRMYEEWALAHDELPGG